MNSFMKLNAALLPAMALLAGASDAAAATIYACEAGTDGRLTIRGKGNVFSPINFVEIRGAVQTR